MGLLNIILQIELLIKNNKNTVKFNRRYSHFLIFEY